ncbi:MAG: chloramphenicol acetyltransferase [Dysgonomonas sp.]
MKQIIDIDSWERRDNYRFFTKFLNPCISITSEVDCSSAKRKAKESNRSFFLYYLYAILKSANEVKELRTRIKRDGQIVLYDKLDVLTPIQVNDDGKFMTVRIPYHEDFDTFYSAAKVIIDSVNADENPYGYTEVSDALDDDNYNVILVSATPNLYFTSVTHTQEHVNGSDFPLLNVGKAVLREGKLVMPVSINIHHGLIDGKHLSDFFGYINKYLA